MPFDLHLLSAMHKNRTPPAPGETLAAEERTLFKQATTDVIRTPGAGRPPIPSETGQFRPRRSPVPPSDEDARQPAEAAPRPCNGEAPVLFQRPGIQPRQLLQLKRGKFRPEAVLDLHGLRQRQAERELRAFIDQSWQEGLRTLLIIHGKGHGSASGTAVLKSWLVAELPRYPQVLAFCSAQPRDGGTGALYLRLRQQPPTL